MRRAAVAIGIVVLLGACSGSTRPDRGTPKPATSRSLDPYRGLGTWVDVYDFVPAFQKPGEVPAVSVDSVPDMARLGVRTLYLQAAQDDTRSAGDVVEPRRVGDMLVAAHAAGMKVVAWYLPHFADVDADLRRLVAMRDFRVRNQRFDAIALDIEWTRDVPDTTLRNERLVDLSRRVREAMRGMAVGAIVYPPVQLDVVNPALWPAFPWRTLSALYDVWLPMSYWTVRSAASPYRDAGRYTSENLAALRTAVGQRAAIHAIGGIADAATARDIDAFVGAAGAGASIGWSVFDFDTTHSDAWPSLRRGH